MPFAHLSYRWLRNQNYDYAKRRRCFIIVCLIYTIVFAVLGAIFLGVYIDKVNYLNSLTCASACGWLGATINCGYQACCDSLFIYSYQYCTGTYTGTYYLLAIIFFCYAAYEFFLMICTLCRGTALQNTTNVIVIDQNPQYVGLNNYQQQQQIYQGNNQMQMQNQQQQQQMYQAQMQRQNQQQINQGNNQVQMTQAVPEIAK